MIVNYVYDGFRISVFELEIYTEIYSAISASKGAAVMTFSVNHKDSLEIDIFMELYAVILASLKVLNSWTLPSEKRISVAEP